VASADDQAGPQGRGGILRRVRGRGAGAGPGRVQFRRAVGAVAVARLAGHARGVGKPFRHAFVPLAAGLYLLNTTAWTAAERTVLMRRIQARQQPRLAPA